MPIRVAIVGPTSYTGLWLMELLLRHPEARISYLASRREEQPDITREFPRLRGRLTAEQAMCRPIDAAAIARECDVAFTCLPHVAAMEIVPKLLDAGLSVIDLSADYRMANAALYEKVYQHAHCDAANLAHAAYGLPELFRDHIVGKKLIANPGCYPTAAALAIAPLLTHSLVKPEGIIVNAASGVTGAGRGVKQNLQFAEQNEAYGAYGTIGGHRHQPEIEQTLARVAGKDIGLLFVPHLLPIDCGILETIYLDPASDDVTADELREAMEDAYEDEPFIRMRDDLPNVKDVRGTNFCDLHVRLVESGNMAKVVVFSVLDNMVKGASGQAVQNMNLMFELPETTGLL